MSKREKLVKIFVFAVIAVGFLLGNGYIFSMSSSGSYASPLPNLVDDALSPERSPIILWGEVLYETNGIPVAGERVRLFATDELFEDIVYTDLFGEFVSTKTFDTGQLLKVEVRDNVYVINIPINVEGSFYVGMFLI